MRTVTAYHSIVEEIEAQKYLVTAEDHTAGKGQSLDSNPDFLSSESMPSATLVNCAIYAEQGKDTGEGLRAKIV